MNLYPFIQHPENSQFGRGTDEGAFELLSPFKVQQPINTKMRRDARQALYSVSRNERYGTLQHHFRAASSNPRIHDVFANEIVWRNRDPQPMTFPEGDIREYGFSALNGLSPLMDVRPVGVAAGTSAGDGMTDFGVTESGLVSMINNSNWDILTGDYVAAIFPTSPHFTSAAPPPDVDRHTGAPLPAMPRRAPIQAINPAGLAPEKLMAAIVPINRLLNYATPEESPFAASMNGMFVMPQYGNKCLLPSYLRRKFQESPVRLFACTRGVGSAPDKTDFEKHCFPVDSDAIRMDIWHNFGLGRAVSAARKGRAFQCLLGAPFSLPRHEWLPRDESP
jgi:hypothetical protein